MYTLYYSPFSCSLAVHMALEKVGIAFELAKIDVRKAAQNSEAFLRVNKRGVVPVLGDGDRYIDQGAAILLYLSEQHPETEILPPQGAPEWAGAISNLFYMSNTVHPAFKMAFYPERYTHGKPEDVLGAALERAKTLMAELDHLLDGQRYLNGDKPYAADYYLSTILNWLQVFKMSLEDYQNLEGYKRRMADLPEVARAFAKELKEY